MMERLTKRQSDGSVIAWHPLEYYNYNDFKKVLDRLAYYEDMEEQGRLVVLDVVPIDVYAGLKRKYFVFKSDTGKIVEDCFVLRPDKDEAAKEALRAYALFTENKQLAYDIFCWVGLLEEAENALKGGDEQ